MSDEIGKRRFPEIECAAQQHRRDDGGGNDQHHIGAFFQEQEAHGGVNQPGQNGIHCRAASHAKNRQCEVEPLPPEVIAQQAFCQRDIPLQ